MLNNQKQRRLEKNKGNIIVRIADWKILILQDYSHFEEVQYKCPNCAEIFTSKYPPSTCPKCNLSLYGFIEDYPHYLIDLHGIRRKVFYSPNPELNQRIVELDISKEYYEMQEKLLLRYKDQNKWEIFQWDDWIPTEIRDQVIEFWHFHNGNPFHWIRDFRLFEPLYGTIVTQDDTGDHLVKGHFVHVWNNMGRVVEESGIIHCVSN
jgi:hypothetical protein